MTEDTRKELHRLLDKMIDEDKPVGTMDIRQCDWNGDPVIVKLIRYRLNLRKLEETMGW